MSKARCLCTGLLWLAPSVELCYNNGEGAAITQAVRTLRTGRVLPSLSRGRGGDLMPTYSDIFQFCLVIIGVISLVIQIINHKRK